MTLYTQLTGTEQEDQQAAASELATACYQTCRETWSTPSLRTCQTWNAFLRRITNSVCRGINPMLCLRPFD